MQVFHGTTQEHAISILKRGIKIQKSGGYFGNAFYVTDDPLLARSNYAFEGGAVLPFELDLSRGHLDLRNPEGFDRWCAFTQQNDLFRADFHLLAVKAGIHSVWDNSMGGFAVYNPKSIRMQGMAPKDLNIPSALFLANNDYTMAMPGSSESNRFGSEKLKSDRYGIQRWKGQHHERYLDIQNGKVQAALMVLTSGSNPCAISGWRSPGDTSLLPGIVTLDHPKLTWDPDIQFEIKKPDTNIRLDFVSR